MVQKEKGEKEAGRKLRYAGSNFGETEGQSFTRPKRNRE